MRYKNFEDWFDEIENFSTRGERFFEEFSHMTPNRAEEWLRACWSCAKDDGKVVCIIAGGRDIEDYQLVVDAVKESGFDIGTVVSGGATGVDSLGERYSEEMSLNLKIFRADWETHGRAAGPIRNRKMAENAEALIAIWDGKSRGTKNMIETAKSKGLAVYIKRVDNVS